MDRRYDVFFETLVEQRIQELKNSKQHGTEDSLPFPSEPLRTAPVTLPGKRVSNTSSDSGVNSPHVLSPAMPITPNKSQPYLKPSTPRMNPRSGPITPIQQFIHNSRKRKKKEPKNSRSQPDHLDRQSVLRSHVRHCYKLQIFIFHMIFTFFTLITSSPLELTRFLLSFLFFILFQMNMPKCHKFYPNCIWHVPPECHGLNFDLALLNRVYWNFATHIVDVCVSSKSPINLNLHVTRKSNLQVHFGFKAMASLHKLLYHHSLTCSDLLLEELLSYLPASFPSLTFGSIA